MWPSALSGRLLIVALVSRYLTNWLIRRGPIPYHRSFSHCKMPYRALMRFYQSFPTAIPRYGAGCPRVTHPSATQSISLPPEGFRLIASFDLHVLGTPPAFILSQDQTLNFCLIFFSHSNLPACLCFFLFILDSSLSAWFYFL